MRNIFKYGKKIGEAVGGEVKNRAEDTLNEFKSTMSFTIKLYTYIGAAIGLGVLTLIGVGVYKLLS